METTLHILIAFGFAAAGVVAAVLALVGLPGAWSLVAIGFATKWVSPELFSWWTLGAVALLALAGEIIETIASGAGAKRAGGARRSALLSIAGGLAGAVAGTIFIPLPIVGTIIGAIAGAAIFATLGERTVTERSWSDAMRVGRGAATGRAWAMLIKTTIAGAIGVTLTIASIL